MSKAPNAQLFGELWIDTNGEAHFICHTKNDDFAATKVAFEKFIALLQGQITNEKECPYYTPEQLERGREQVDLIAKHFPVSADALKECE